MPFDDLPLRPPIEPMETRQVASIPLGADWSYEPKWDGFRCVAFRSGDDVELESKSGQSLTRYFPEIVAALKQLKARRFVVDGEVYVESGAGFDFDALLQRIHPAASRVQRLSQETPARYAVFDLLVDADGKSRFGSPLRQRREELEAFARRYFGKNVTIGISPATTDAAAARAWLAGDAARLDGVVAKRLDAAYDFGGRDAVVKIKRRYTADCVVGGFRTSPAGDIASLLLGLYGDDGKLDHVGFVGSMTADERRRAAELLRPLAGGSGFSGNAPGGPSRWRKGEVPWTPVDPKIVVEVSFDHVTARRFRHAARLLRWRPDKAPKQCTIEQLLEPK